MLRTGSAEHSYTLAPIWLRGIHMHTCQNCHEPVTAQFARVFGDNDGRVFSCPHCADAVAERSREKQSQAA